MIRDHFEFVGVWFEVTMFLLCPVILLICLYLITKDKEFDSIPGPPGVFLLHNTLDFLMDREALFYYIRKIAATYNGLFKVRFGPIKGIFIQTPEDIEKVINDVGCSEKGIMYNILLEPWLKEGLLLNKDPKWYQRRKLLTPAFNFNVMPSYKSIIEEKCQIFVDKLENEIEASKTDVTPYVNDFAIHSICEAAMGSNLEEFHQFINTYREGIRKLGNYAIYRAQRVWLYSNFVFKFTAVGKKVEQVIKKLTYFRDRVIQYRMKLYNMKDLKINTNEAIDDDSMDLRKKQKLIFLDLLLHAEKQGVINTKGISEEVDTFIFAGHETSSITLQFLIMLLANNQEAQAKVVEECNKIYESPNHDGTTMADLAQMKYLECCIKECLRLYPPVPILNRKVKNDICLGNYRIPAGTECGILIYDLQRRSDQFVEPHEFRPERFLTEPTWHPYAYIPFSAGPRNCIGQKFSMMEIKLAISALLRRYRLLPVTKLDDITFLMDLVLRLKDPIYVKIEKR